LAAGPRFCVRRHVAKIIGMAAWVLHRNFCPLAARSLKLCVIVD
jgi:hypothetical protein